MASAKLTITDSADGSVIVVIESDPPIALDSDGNPIVDELSEAQAVAIGAALAISNEAQSADWRTLIKNSDLTSGD